MARPTKYTPDTIKKSEEYLKGCEDTYKLIKGKQINKVTLQEEEVTIGSKLKVNLPSHVGLALYLDVRRETLYEWAKVHDEFSNILETILKAQERKLIEEGLSGTYNSNIAKLVLGKHGYHDKQELTGKDGKDLIPPEAKEAGNKAVDALINAKKREDS